MIVKHFMPSQIRREKVKESVKPVIVKAKKKELSPLKIEYENGFKMVLS